jgi:hypothetical protein
MASGISASGISIMQFSGSRALRAAAVLALLFMAPGASAEVVEKVVKLPVRVSIGGEVVTRESR